MLDNNWNKFRKWFSDMWVVSSESQRNFEEIVKQFPLEKSKHLREQTLIDLLGKNRAKKS